MLSDEVKSTKKELLASIKDNQGKYESEIKGLKEKLETVTEAQQEAESQLIEHQQKSEFEAQQSQEREKSLTCDLEIAQTELADTKKELGALKDEMEQVSSAKLAEMEDEIELLREAARDQKAKLADQEK